MSRTRSAAPAPPRLRRAIPLLISLLAALSLTSGCASLAPSPPRSGADGLRAAAEETKKRPEDQKPLVVRPRPEPSEVSNTVVVVDREAHVDAEPVEEPPAAPRHRSLQGWHAGLVGGTGTIGGPTFAPAGEFGLKIGMTPSRGSSLDLDLLTAIQRFRPASGLVGSFEEPIEFAADLSFRHQLTRDGRPLAIAPLAGMRFATETWNYRHGVVADDGSGLWLIQDDMIDSYSPYVGFGLTLHDSRRFRLGAAVKTGVSFYDAHSYQGFRNDAFPTSGFVQVQLETSFPF